MKPSNELIVAWHKYLDVHQQAQGAIMKAGVMFKYAATDKGVDAELYNRASELHKQGIRLHRHALALWRKALKTTYDKRYRIHWRDYQTCTVWVHEPYSQDKIQMRFSKSLRLKKT